jgi:hypothetical protein
MSTLMLCFLTWAEFSTHKLLFLRINMSEQGYRILEAWLLDLLKQGLTDENIACRIRIATRYLEINNKSKE